MKRESKLDGYFGNRVSGREEIIGRCYKFKI